ncbi:23S rRNA (pseudouridine(1915)-N(3))-methyltransferase RlmH [Legionella septentrionalis]|uniref:Ribosomal RNA large subunit methyltransferase H n=1 Tax=Legionella septentrionalis TaxID=2498109 RepID=A0A3S0V4P8_9GAMM|nr:23S rRNA (pseudouridine(1915)-N(3))-methyltransferase RlmH [Legionella septentrionalis]RUQ81895.1 23S rRNA (pseudouridine(1915)-N(3))-methyltransferase RlmH [Legionella septentrionalis]RUR00265.1 23S rRNA (pseudouridine(1915)-N(3))-methyltransferase RlmH [Legionella septentrionalis]RUR17565.1 23S rRNA (pseudouridine(1915)-N(3))-methyltransferase RlmH [Legionella septentrionalis]
MFKITLVTLGNKMPLWVQQGMQEYAKRLQDGIQLSLIEIPLIRRGKSADLSRILEKEMALMSAAIPAGARLIALDMKGEMFSSEGLAAKLAQLQQVNSHVCVLIGGPEGLSSQLIKRSHEQWSLSKLTLPHPLARIVFIEAIYRAWCILHHHPYHK